MMRFHRLTTLIGTLALLSGCFGKRSFQSVYLQGPPTSITTQKKAEQSVTTVRATVVGNSIQITAKRSTGVFLRRDVHRSTFAIQGRGDPSLEPLEWLLGWIVVVFPTILLAPIPSNIRGPEVAVEYAINPYFIFIHPSYTMFGTKFEGTLLQKDEFPEPESNHRYKVALPAAYLKMSYRLLNSLRETVQEGQFEVDQFGEFEIADIPNPDRAVALEIEAAGAKWMIALER